MRDQRVLDAIQAFDRAGKWIGAICAAALALQAAGILTLNRKVTCHPAVEKKLTTVPRQTARTVVDGRLITSQGPGTAFDFVLTLIRQIDGPAKAESLSREMVLT
jgi:putative intracellular protease/amidase